MRTAAGLALVGALAVAGCTAEETGEEPTPAAPAPPAIETVASDTLTACIAPTPGLVEWDGDGWQGYDVGVLQLVAEQLALDLELVEATFDEVVSGVALNGGRCDVGAGGVVDHASLDSVVRTSDAYRTVHRVVVTTTSGSTVTPAEVTGTVGVLEGGPATDAVDSLESAEVVPYPSQADLQGALTAGAVDAALVTVMERARLESETGQLLHLLSRVETDDETVLVLPLGVADADVAAVDGALADAREDGRLARLAEQWLTS